MKHSDSLIAKTLYRTAIASVAALPLFSAMALADSSGKKAPEKVGTTAIQATVNNAIRNFNQSNASIASASLDQSTSTNLRRFSQTHHAQRWATLEEISKDPTLFSNQVVVIPATVVFALNDNRVILNSDPEIWEGSNAVLRGEDLKNWQPGAQLLAIRVLGRSAENQCEKGNHYCGLPQLQLVGNLACKDPFCRDQLNIPTNVSDTH